MRIFRTIFVFLLIFVFILFASKTIVLGAYTATEIKNGVTEGGYVLYVVTDRCAACGTDATCLLGCAGTDASSYAPGQDYSGFYEWPPDSGSYYAIGGPPDPIYNPGGSGGGGGGGPEAPVGCVGAACCTGVYGSCTGWGACSATCGPGTQTRGCFDTGCGTLQTQSQACQINDPDVWGPPTTCTVNCGGGTQDRTNQCGTTETIACNTSACPAWTKLKDSSFISPNNLSNMIALAPAAYDADDTTEQFFIVGKGGVVAAPGISLDISTVSPTAKTGNPEYKVIYTPKNYSLTPNSFLSYIKARKEYKVITDLNEITESGIYVFNGDISISSNVNPFDQPYKVVLIVSGTVTVSTAPDNTFTPAGTAAIVASTINFDSTMTEAQGIFIGNNVSTGTNAVFISCPLPLGEVNFTNLPT